MESKDTKQGKNPEKTSGSKSRDRKFKNRDRKSSKSKFQDHSSMDAAKDGKKCKLCVHNDYKWYTSGPNGNIPFNVPFSDPLGCPLHIATDAPHDNVILTDNTEPLPGIMSIPVAPSIGQATSIADPINTAFFKLHSALRYGQSYSHTYDTAHLGMYLLAADSVVMLIEHWKRIYGLLRYYSAINRYCPDTYLNALGVDGPYFYGKDLDAVREYINHMIDVCSIIKIPANWYYFERHKFMFQTIYMDSNISKPQAYAFVPAYLYKYTFSTTPGDFTLTAIPYDYSNPRTFQQLVSWTEQFINAFAQDDSLSIIAGDFMRYYGSEGLYKWEYIEPNYVTMPQIDVTVLQSIHNARPIPINAWSLTRAQLDKFNVTEDLQTGALQFTPHYVSSSAATTTRFAALNFGPIVDLNEEDPSAELVSEATRLSVGAASATGSDGNTTFTFYAVGSEIPFQPIIWTLNNAGGVVRVYTSMPTSNVADTWNLWYRMSKFQWAPLVPYVTASGSTISINGYMGNMENYTVMTVTQLERMHLNAMLSELGVPKIEVIPVNIT